MVAKILSPKDLRVDWPEGEAGPWKVRRFTVSEEASHLDGFMASLHGNRRYCPPGEYTGLYRGGAVIMSDTPDEIRDLYDAIRMAQGRVLINGLGLGVLVKAILQKPEVERVDVIEVDLDVITLIEGNFNDERLHIYEGNALDYQWPAGTKWDVAWHDIWDSICTDNLKEMATLKRRYARRVDWQGCWCEPLCRYHQRREKRYSFHW